MLTLHLQKKRPQHHLVVLDTDPSVWFWTLDRGGRATADFRWEEIVQGLETLQADSDSFLILEHKKSGTPETYVYLQAAIALEGAETGQYILGCGFSTQNGPQYFERYVQTLEQACAYFRIFYERQSINLQGFTDTSDKLN
jgi:hypothetical protein